MVILLMKKMMQEIEVEMRKIIKENYDFKRNKISIKKAKEFYAKNNFKDKLAIIKYRPEKSVHIYTCGDYSNYFYSYMVPSTGYLSKFKLLYHKGGIIIQYPRSEANGEIPLFKDEKVYSKTLNEASEWAKEIKAETVTQINENVKSENLIKFVNQCEDRHVMMLKELGDKIIADKRIKLIAIAGPSSSGKTTFSDRLMD